MSRGGFGRYFNAGQKAKRERYELYRNMSPVEKLVNNILKNNTDGFRFIPVKRQGKLIFLSDHFKVYIVVLGVGERIQEFEPGYKRLIIDESSFIAGSSGKLMSVIKRLIVER